MPPLYYAIAYVHVAQYTLCTHTDQLSPSPTNFSYQSRTIHVLTSLLLGCQQCGISPPIIIMDLREAQTLYKHTHTHTSHALGSSARTITLNLSHFFWWMVLTMYLSISMTVHLHSSPLRTLSFICVASMQGW